MGQKENGIKNDLELLEIINDLIADITQKTLQLEKVLLARARKDYEAKKTEEK